MVNLDIIINNNEEEINYSDIEANIIDNTINFKIGNDNYTLTKNDNLKLFKENNDSILELIFNINKETNGTYFIKSMNYNMDAKVRTNELIINNKKIYVRYNFNLQDEDLGIYSMNINIKE